MYRLASQGRLPGTPYVLGHRSSRNQNKARCPVGATLVLSEFQLNLNYEFSRLFYYRPGKVKRLTSSLLNGCGLGPAEWAKPEKAELLLVFGSLEGESM